ncbi:hypothetical protein AWJ20_4820 [Sugiyamaella lignohabitans]|uniref:DNA replication regulator SLD2 n=1 Tax=Sugiyamaella lignohabitans TaxID=796027 RepID=A0A167EBE2_9ASCO|nr:uncharacterized protein AWJ20_4820 [Sugiyamaella lignohabitans]ANB13869.1 hypothetical protein AWJ20_4820 [Sugiyamaella lignohabitans]
MGTGPSQSEIHKIKLEIKKWEYSFQETHGRKPGYDDIRAIPDIHIKYKTYNRYKSGTSRASKNVDDNDQAAVRKLDKPLKSLAQYDQSTDGVTADSTGYVLTPHGTRSYREDLSIEYISRSPSRRSAEYDEGFKGNAASHRTPSTPQKKKNAEMAAAILAAKIGPTPQMDGRVLGIFEFTSPDAILQTPSAKKQKYNPSFENALLNTPSKKRTKSVASANPISPPRSDSPVRAVDSNSHAEPDANLSHTILATPAKSKTSSPFNMETPSKTPTYLNHRISSMADSPIAPRRLGRTLSSMMAELRDIKKEQETGGFDPDDGFDINEIADLNEEDLYSDFNDSQDDTKPKDSTEPGPIYKKKGQKRTTKRVKMKPILNENDPIDESAKRARTLPKKQPENFQRLKLHNSGYKTNKSKFFFGRRSR